MKLERISVATMSSAVMGQHLKIVDSRSDVSFDGSFLLFLRLLEYLILIGILKLLSLAN